HQQGIPVPALALRPRFPWAWPCVRRLKMPWSVACAIVLSVLVLVALVITVGFSVAIPRMLQSLPNDDVKAQAFYSRIRERIQQISPVQIDPQYLPEDAKQSEAVKYIQGALNPNTSPFIVNALLRLAAYGSNWVWQSILIMFILLFLLLEGRMLTRRVVEIFGPGAQVQGKAVEALKDMAYQIRAYLVWRTIINFGMGAFLGIVYHVLGLKLAWTWALL